MQTYIKLILVLFGIGLLSKSWSSELPELFSNEMLSAMARSESNCGDKRYLIGDDKTSIGLYQIKLSTAQFLGFKTNRKELLNPFINETIARAYLLYLSSKIGLNTERVLIAYNCGEKNANIRLPAKCYKIKKPNGKIVPSCGCYIIKIKNALKNPCPI
jgi:hypothetical protein